MLVHHYLEYYVRDTPDAPCFGHHRVSMSYSEVNAAANQMANGCSAWDVEKEQKG